MSEKVLGFKAMEKELMKYRCLDCGQLLMEDQAAVDCPYCSGTNITDLVPVVSLEWLEKELDACSFLIKDGIKFIEKHELLTAAKIRAGEK